MPKLVIFRGDEVENEIRLAGQTVRIGRDSRNDIVLDDKSVSRFHAEVRAEGNSYNIVDLKSRNGVWVKGQQAKGKATLALGTPVTLGAFELTLEDDVPTGEFDELAPVLDPPRAAKVPSASDQPSRSATRAAMRAPVTTTRRDVLLWSGAAAAVLLICGITFAVVRYRGRPATAVEVVTPPPLPPSPQVQVVQPPPPPVEDPTKATIDQHVADAQAGLTKGDYATVREHVARVLELDPGNQAALELRRQADAGARGAKPPQVAAATTTATAEVEVPGIPRRPAEASADYTARVQRIDVNFKAARSYLDKQDFPLALARLRLVERDQKGYQGIEALIADTLTKQRAALDNAMDSGQRNEQAGNLKVARQWYQRAVLIDPNATSAHDKDVALLNRMTPDANRLLNRASSAAKTDDVGQATRLYGQIMDMLLPGDEIREKAAKQLETLKR